MSQIVESKFYEGKDLETIFFRPMFSELTANGLGVRVLYNMPVPTTINLWRAAKDALQKYMPGWNGASTSEKLQKSIKLYKVKAEMGYSAADYFSMVFEQMANSSDMNLDDLSGTELEEAETQLFKEAIAESIRATIWLGRVERSNKTLSSFNGIINKIITDTNDAGVKLEYSQISDSEYNEENAGEKILKKTWEQASLQLKESKGEGNLVYFVSSNIYSKYEDSLDSSTVEAAYLAKQNGRESLSYRGIPVVDLQLSGYSSLVGDMPEAFALLTDRRNITLAVNTSDFPGTEVRMWYNPDEMENRQRAVFMAGCDYLLPELISFSYKV